jgi:PAT family beta-lactamase induction signal transducer AmpG
MTRRAPAPWLFALLSVPHAVVMGGVSGTLLSFLLRQQGVAPHAIANQRALLLLPGSLFFLWSPLTDFLLRRKTWLVLSTAASSVTVMLALESRSYAGKSAVTLLWTSSCLILLAYASIGGLVALLMRPEQKTRVGCFLQAGNLAGVAFSGGGLLLLAAHVSKAMLALAAGALTFLPALPALSFDEAPAAKRGKSLVEEMVVMGQEFKKTFLRLSALPAVLLLVSPLGSGGAIGILSSVAKDYGVSGNQVAWTNGLVGGVLTFAGAIAMALMPANFDIRMAYVLTGLLNAGVLGVFCFGTPRPWMYIVGSSLFLFTVGACWAMYSALVLKIVGAPGRSGCGRYAMAVSLANLPAAYMAAVDGWGAKWFGPKGLPGMDMAVSGVASLAFLAWFCWERVSGFKTELGLVDELAGGAEALSA